MRTSSRPKKHNTMLSDYYVGEDYKTPRSKSAETPNYVQEAFPASTKEETPYVAPSTQNVPSLESSASKQEVASTNTNLNEEFKIQKKRKTEEYTITPKRCYIEDPDINLFPLEIYPPQNNLFEEFLCEGQPPLLPPKDTIFKEFLKSQLLKKEDLFVSPEQTLPLRSFSSTSHPSIAKVMPFNPATAKTRSMGRSINTNNNNPPPSAKTVQQKTSDPIKWQRLPVCPPISENIKLRPSVDIPETIVFYPSEEEFKDPMQYIKSIAPQAKRYGICKIIPPSDNWLDHKTFEQRVDIENFAPFQTKLQNLHQLQNRKNNLTLFLASLNKFRESNNLEPIEELPILNGVSLDLSKLLKEVTKGGGFHKIKNWELICSQFLGASNKPLVSSLKQHYQNLLLSYEEHLASNKPTIQIPSRFGYGEGGSYSLPQYIENANSFARAWFGHDVENYKFMEQVYWSLVESGDHAVQVMYGSDLSTAAHQSGFLQTPESMSGWNLHAFPMWQGSVLSHLAQRIEGINTPMLYVGMLFSTFCWHFEDNYLYSINYNHTGAPKLWYGIPGDSYYLFENAMRETIPEIFKADPSVLFQLVTMISPRILVQKNVPIFTTLQHAGEIILTFPRAYHAGFNTGFNFAESCNFALPDFIPLGRNCTERYRQFGRASVFSMEDLMLKMLLNYPSSEEFQWLQPELRMMILTEASERKLALNPFKISKALPFSKFFSSNSSTPECKLCRFDCFLSAVVCPCSPSKPVCIRHFDRGCKCSPSEKILLFRHTLSDLHSILIQHNINVKEDLLQQHLNIEIIDSSMKILQTIEDWASTVNSRNPELRCSFFHENSIIFENIPRSLLPTSAPILRNFLTRFAQTKNSLL